MNNKLCHVTTYTSISIATLGDTARCRPQVHIMPGKSSKAEKNKPASPVQSTGVFIFANGEKYNGEYVQTSGGCIERSGTGTHTLTDGVVYSGQWTKDKMNGKGTMQHPSGAKYEGQFVENEYHGKGVYTWPDGSTFTGEFVHNKLTGAGEYADSDGHLWTGQFNEKSNTSTLRLKLS